jgi:adenylate cyclase
MSGQTAVEPAAAERPEPGWPGHPVAAWLAGQDNVPAEAAALLAGLCERLVAAGVPITRVSAGLSTLHPQLSGRQFIWRRDEARVAAIPYGRGVERSSDYRESPVRALHRSAGPLRRRLEGPERQLDFPLLEALAAEGATDYLAMALRFGSGRGGYVSWVTDRPGGFDAEALALIEGLLPLLALRLELEANRDMTRGLLATYLGGDAARRVLSGEIERGRGERIRAAILLADLRGFTALSDRLPAEEVMVLLNDYFDIVTTQVEKHRGQVLKFIGDGLLAVFDVEGSSRGTACCQAVHAAIDAVRALAAWNRGRTEPLELGIALHLDDVLYGNIGAAGRLDFTVIGKAVNEAARIEALRLRAAGLPRPAPSARHPQATGDLRPSGGAAGGGGAGAYRVMPRHIALRASAASARVRQRLSVARSRRPLS